MNRKIQIHIKWITSLMMITSSMFVLQIAGRTVFLWLQILFCIAMVLHRKKLTLMRYPIVNFIFAELFISAFSALATDMPDTYKKTAIVLPIMLLPLYFTASYLINMIRNDPNWIQIIKKAIKAMVIIQIVWIMIQAFAYYLFHTDVNDLIFAETLGLVENASFIRSWIYYPSGLSWHSAMLAPLFVLGFVLFENKFVRALIIAESIICGNSTTIIGVLACMAVLVLLNLKNNLTLKKISRKKIFAIGMLILLGTVILFEFNFWTTVTKSIGNLWERLFGAEKDASTLAHMGYFADYAVIFKKSSLFQNLFGYGYGCSGYTISVMHNRYTALSNWSIECDIVDILVSRGIVGFIGYYIFLIYIAIKGLKIDYRYFVVMLVIFIQGFGYNIQFDYLLLIELILFITIKLHVNFFDETNIKSSK